MYYLLNVLCHLRNVKKKLIALHSLERRNWGKSILIKFAGQKEK